VCGIWATRGFAVFTSIWQPKEDIIFIAERFHRLLLLTFKHEGTLTAVFPQFDHFLIHSKNKSNYKFK